MTVSKANRPTKLEVSGHNVVLPTFMPVGTRGAVKGLSPEDVKSTGADIILANTYHMHLSPGEKTVKKLGQLHKFMNWNGPILTDSGGYQVFSLAKNRKISEEGVEFRDPTTGDKHLLTPEKSIQIQFDLGANIIMAFDDVVSLDKSGRKRTKEAMERTHRWLVRSIDEHKKLSKKIKNPPLLFGIAQGGLDKDLRKQSLEFIQSQDVPGVAIGGLSVGETRKEMHDMLEFLSPMYDYSRPHYLMGVGHPIDMRKAIEEGIDMFDCVMATRNARHGNAWITGDKTLNLKAAANASDPNPIDKNCDCYACSHGYSRGFLRSQLKANEPLAGRLISIHNLKYVQDVCRSYQS